MLQELVKCNKKLKSMYGATNQCFVLCSLCIYQMVQFFSRIRLSSIVYSSFRGDTREDQGAIQPRNQNESGGLMASARKAASCALDKCYQWFSHPVSQCSYIDRDPNITSSEIIYSSVVERCSKTPYPFKFQDPTRIITGIVCVPKDNKTSSPEVEVISGGVGCKEVEIVLTPVQKGDWACRVEIIGITANRLEMNPISNQLTT
jgi:hypothetical protein